MHQSFEVETNSTPERLFDVLTDLGLYPRWLDLVDEAVPLTSQSGEAHGELPAWDVTLRAKLGPFARSKRLRMVRSIADSPTRVRFERSEVDGREHSDWTMNVGVSPSPNGSSAKIELLYGGELWSKALESILMSQVHEAAPKLRKLAEQADS